MGGTREVVAELLSQSDVGPNQSSLHGGMIYRREFHSVDQQEIDLCAIYSAILDQYRYDAMAPINLVLGEEMWRGAPSAGGVPFGYQDLRARKPKIQWLGVGDQPEYGKV